MNLKDNFNKEMTINFNKDDYWLNINKPIGKSSAHIVAIIKKITGAKKVGHGGTLDPFASGVLPIAVNKSTKQSALIMDWTKKYYFRIVFGQFRDSDDVTGNIVEESNQRVSKQQFVKSLANFCGNIKQIPSKFSAIKINGKRSYELARQGLQYDMPSRDISIYSLKLLDYNDIFCDIEVECSKGTYIRSLAHDICRFNNICGYVAKLERVAVGNFLLNNAILLDDLNYVINMKQSLKDGSLLDMHSMSILKKR